MIEVIIVKLDDSLIGQTLGNGGTICLVSCHWMIDILLVFVATSLIGEEIIGSATAAARIVSLDI